MAQGSTDANVAEIYVKLVPLTERNRSVFQFVDDVQPKVIEGCWGRAKVGFHLQTASGSTPKHYHFLERY